MFSGMDHHFTCISTDGECIMPTIKFGNRLKDNTGLPDNTSLAPNTKLRVGVDLENITERKSREKHQRFPSANLCVISKMKPW